MDVQYRRQKMLLKTSFIVVAHYTLGVASFAPLRTHRSRHTAKSCSLTLPLQRIQQQHSGSSSSTTALYEKKGWTTSLFPVLPSSDTITIVSPPSPPTTTSKIINIKQQVVPPLDKRFGAAAYVQTLAGTIGALAGILIAGFKLSIENIRDFAYGDVLDVYHFPVIFVPVLGGAAVSVLALMGGGGFPPGVRGIVTEADRDSLNMNEQGKIEELMESFRKASAAIFTLGTGCSLGPEGPGVEIGIAASRLGTLAWPTQIFDDYDKETDTIITNGNANGDDSDEMLKTNAARIRRNRLFLACGAAAGVSSGFNAPLAGVFFALEVIQKNLPSIILPSTALQKEEQEVVMNGNNALEEEDNAEQSSSGISTFTTFELQQESLSGEAGSITAILTSSVVSALISRELLGNELALRLLDYEIPTPLLELPIYLCLGAASGLTAVAFSQTAQLAKAAFDGEVGPQPIRDVIDATPGFVKPMIGGLTCGLIGLYLPNILFFGYETLNGLLLNNQMATDALLVLLIAKIFATAVSAGSGLVGGTLAPSLFMGGMVGAIFHNILVSANIISDTLVNVDMATTGGAFVVADIPAYTMVGAASCLAAVFRAPLTASLLAFELTRDYEVLVPLLASAGVGTLLCDLVESRIDQAKTKNKKKAKKQIPSTMTVVESESS